jgi:hypothetical protein
MLERYLKTWCLHPDKHVANPPNRGNPDLLRLCLFLFDLDPNEALDHCKNLSMPNGTQLYLLARDALAAV